MKSLYKKLIVLILLISIGLVTKSSFKMDNSELKVDLTNFKIYNTNVNENYYDSIDNIEDIFNKSSVIARVKMTNKKEYLNQCTLSNVKLIEIYKNDTNIQLNEEINIYEPVDIKKNETIMYTTTGYIPMIEDKEYIVFLKSLRVPEGYNMSKREKLSFMYCNAQFGKYSIDNLSPYVVDTADTNDIYFRDVKNINVILNKSNSNIYNDLTREIYKRYITI